MRRRLDLAQSLVHRPTVLFLDEPTTGLDPQSRNALWEDLRRRTRGERVTILPTTQYLEEADQDPPQAQQRCRAPSTDKLTHATRATRKERPWQSSTSAG